MEAKPKRSRPRRKKTRTIVSYVIGLGVYSVFVFVYLLVVAWLLHGHLKDLFDAHRISYALAALGLIIFQGVALDAATTAVMRLVSRWR